MRLYHLSFVPVDAFSPRIPKVRAKGEDHQINRICFSDDISRCLLAMPDMGIVAPYLNSLNVPLYLWVHEIDTDILEENEWHDPSFTKHFVPDAEKTHEYWVYKSLQDDDIKRSVILVEGKVIGDEICYKIQKAAPPSSSTCQVLLDKTFLTEKQQKALLNFLKKEWGEDAERSFITHMANGDLAEIIRLR